MRRKNTKFIDPRYFMDEKTEKSKVLKEGQIGPDKYISQDPAWGSSNPPEYTPAAQLKHLQDRLANVGKGIPGQADQIESQIKALLDAHPELAEEPEAQE